MSYLDDVRRAMDLVAEASELIGPYLPLGRTSIRSSVELHEADAALDTAYQGLWAVIVEEEAPYRRKHEATGVPEPPAS